MTSITNGKDQRGNRWSVIVWGGAAVLLLIPLVAMQFTREVTWDGSDFLVFGAMLAIACGIWELAMRTTQSGAYRVAVGVAVATAFFQVWVNLAVGIIGSEDNPANLMFFGILGVALAGAAVARFRPEGMARALAVTAGTQALVGAIALFSGMANIIPITAVFTTLWLASAWLSRKSAME